MPAVIDETKKKHGRLRVLYRVENSPHGKVRWQCKCKCGKRVVVIGSNLRKRTTRSCGCLQKELAAKKQWKHGFKGTPEYRAWKNIKTRCYNPRSTRYDRWGGRGIRMCKRWRDSFQNFYDDVGPRPSPKHSLDRYPDGDGDYKPGNVRWATRSEQNLNKPPMRYVTITRRQRSTKCRN